MTSAVTWLIADDELSVAELSALRLDGEIFPLGRAFVAGDVAENRDIRASSVFQGLPGRLIAERATAAWIFGVADQLSTRLQFGMDSTSRVRVGHSRLLEVREVVIDIDTETEQIAGYAVTSTLRTALDLVRSDFYSEVQKSWTSRLLRLADAGMPECRRALDKRPNLPFKKRAIDRLARALNSD